MAGPLLPILQHLSSLGMQQLGRAPNPYTGQPEVDLDRAEETIGWLETLQERLASALEPEEKTFLDDALAGLQARLQEEKAKVAGGGDPLAGALEVRVADTRILIARADATKLAVDALISPDTTDLSMNKGAAWNIQLAAGKEVLSELVGVRPLAEGMAAVTSGGRLPAGKILHVACVASGRPLTAQKIRAGVQAALRTAEREGFRRIAMPIFGYRGAPVTIEECAKAQIGGLVERLQEKPSSVEEVILAIFGQQAHEIFQKTCQVFKETFFL